MSDTLQEEEDQKMEPNIKWPCGIGDHDGCAGIAQLRRTGGPSRCKCDCHKKQEDQKVWLECCQGYTHAPWCSLYREPTHYIECQFCEFRGTFAEGAEHRRTTMHLIRTVATGELRRSQSSSELEPAARGGGEEWFVEGGSLVGRRRVRDEARYWVADAVADHVADQIVREHNQHQSLIAERERLREALQQIAAFDDDGANMILRKTGSYSGFDEPGAVQTARETLADQKGRSE